MPLTTVPLIPLEVWMRVIDGRRILAQIVKAETTQRGLAAAIGHSSGYIGDLCSGRRKTCSTEVAHKIAEALGVTVDSLFLLESSIQETQSVRPNLTPRKRIAAAPVVTSRRGRSRGRAA